MENQCFAPFSRLPPELRIHIWHFSSLVPRVVPLQLRCQQSPRRDSYGDSDVFALCHPPALLSVNHEARSTALETYVLAFSTPTSPGVYFSCAHDTLCIPYSFCTPFSFRSVGRPTDPPPGTPMFFTSFASTLALVKNIAVSGIWAPHSMKLWRIGVLNDTYQLIRCFRSRERFIFLHDTGAVASEWRIVDTGRADEGQGETEELRDWMENHGGDLYETGQISYEYGTLVAADQRETPLATSDDSDLKVVGRKRWYKRNIPKILLHKIVGRRA